MLAQIKSERVSDTTLREIVQRAGVQIGDPITEDLVQRIRAAAAGVDEHIRVEFSPTERGIMLVLIAP